MTGLVTKNLQERLKSIPEERSPLISDEENGTVRYFPYITSLEDAEASIVRAVEYFVSVHGHTPKSFVDLGCGRGGVLCIAKDLGLTEVTGVEFKDEYINDFKTLQAEFPQYQDIQIVNGDIMDWVPERPVDIIYTYKPIAFEDLWFDFLINLHSVLDDGQIIIYQLGAPKVMSKPVEMGYGVYVVDKSYIPFNIQDLNEHHGPKLNAMRLIGGRYIYQCGSVKTIDGKESTVVSGTYITKSEPEFDPDTWGFFSETERLD